VAGIGSVPSLIVGVGAGAAASAAFEPALERPKQDAWLAAPNRLPDIGLIADLIAGGKVTPQDGLNMARRLGYDSGPLDALVWLAQNRLSGAEMLRFWRLFPNYSSPGGKSIDALVDETLAHERLDWDYRDLYTQLRYGERPGIGDIAYSVVRGYLPTNIPLPVAPPATSTKVKRFPQSSKLAETWAQEIGYDSDALELMIARSGLSLAPIFAANAYFRGLLADDDYHLAIAEGDLRTEWADVLRDAARQIPTVGEIVENHLRGWSTLQDMYDGVARHGMQQPDADLVFQTHRRPLSVPTITKALARGGTFNPSANEIQDPYSASVHQANLGPEWYDLGEKMRYTFPSAFVVRALLKDGAISATEAENIFLYEGWQPGLAKTVATHYAPSGTATADPHVTKAENQLWTTTHKSYVGEMIDDTTATAALTAAGVSAAAVTPVLTVWGEERSLIRKQLTPAQIAKAVKTGAINPATNVAWSIADAHQALLNRGYDANDATTLLEESA
jgi:hypothetical protein